ncbi:MAG: hypothetical protein A2Z50_05570 [Nitrospirae bacterium RBG_19FT_COMBO_42_15]|nr:MAG: hypothetical protein A2Z50_05570 [Nitrospirae bacterium RBG_19FT_COMBO_42_15]
MMKKDALESLDDKMEIEVPKEKRYLNTASYDYSVQFLVNLMSGDIPKIILEVPFQRQFIWKEDRASQLIESVIMNVPIPPLYFAEEEDGRWLVVDGLQRLKSLLRYSQNEYGLKSLEIVKELEGLKYKDIPPKAESLLNDGLMRINVIKKDSHPDIKYDIFMRLNKGSVTLNYQELRNCLYRSPLNNMAKEFVSKNKDFQKVLKLKKPHNRYLDVEFIMRVFALQEKLIIEKKENKYIIENYNGRMVNFINDYMDKSSKLSTEEAKKLLDEFKETIEKVVEVFGHQIAFKDITAKTLRFNKAIGEFICISFRRFNKEVLRKRKDEVNNLLRTLLEGNDKFKISISQRTSDTDVINYRINYWLKALENVLSV